MDVSNQVPGLKRNKGLKTWRIMDENGNWYSKYEVHFSILLISNDESTNIRQEVPSTLHSVILPTMFPKNGLVRQLLMLIFIH